MDKTRRKWAGDLLSSPRPPSARHASASLCLWWTSLTVGTNMWRWSVWMDPLQTQSWGFTDFFLQWTFNNLRGVCHIFISSTVCVSCSVFVSGIVTFKENQNISGFQLLGGGVGAYKKLCVWIKCRLTGSWFRACPHLVLHADWMKKKHPVQQVGRESSTFMDFISNCLNHPISMATIK